MLFTIQNKHHLSIERLRTKTLLAAYSTIQNYRMKASDTVIDQYIQQQYNISLKNLCIKLLLNLTF